MSILDNVLKPYADSQPSRRSMQTKSIERIPLIVSPMTGEVTEEFQKFYDDVVRRVSKDVWDIYAITDNAVGADDLRSMIETTIQPVWGKYRSLSDRCKGIDVELNLGRFEQKHRNLIGGFFIMLYMIEDVENELSEHKSTILTQYYTELLFTYKSGEFKLLSVIKPFVKSED